MSPKKSGAEHFRMDEASAIRSPEYQKREVFLETVRDGMRAFSTEAVITRR